MPFTRSTAHLPQKWIEPRSAARSETQTEGVKARCSGATPCWGILCPRGVMSARVNYQAAQKKVFKDPNHNSWLSPFLAGLNLGSLVGPCSVQDLPFHWLITLPRVRSGLAEGHRSSLSSYSFLIKVEPASDVATVSARQRGSVCSSLLSDVGSLITHNFRSLC